MTGQTRRKSNPHTSTAPRAPATEANRAVAFSYRSQDVDVVYARGTENLGRIARALRPLEPYLRGAPSGLPFSLDERTLAAGLNFTLSTRAGDIDLLGEITGGGDYGALLEHSIEVELFGARCRCLDLPTLIAVKMAAGRPKDLEAIAELRALLDEQPPKAEG